MNEPLATTRTPSSPLPRLGCVVGPIRSRAEYRLVHAGVKEAHDG